MFAAFELAHLFVDVGPLTIIINNDGGGIRNNSNAPPPLNACILLTESSEASREGDVMEPEKGASLVGGQGEVGEVVVGRGQGGVGGHLVG